LKRIDHIWLCRPHRKPEVAWLESTTLRVPFFSHLSENWERLSEKKGRDSLAPHDSYIVFSVTYSSSHSRDVFSPPPRYEPYFGITSRARWLPTMSRISVRLRAASNAASRDP